MESFQSATASRGRSRFSKALPLPPQAAPPPISKDMFSVGTSGSTSIESPLPPIPRESPPLPKSKMPPITIPRRPVGSVPSVHSKGTSIASASSVYTTSPGFSRSLSNGSNTTKDSMSEIDSESALTPSPPPKDNHRQKLSETTNAVFTTSPSRPIWKRRSVKSDRSINIQDLTLKKSNGSTASPPRQPPSERALPHLPHLPRSRQGRAIPARPAPPQPSGMGNELSKKLNHRSGESSQDAQPQSFSVSSVKRLPTPEYLLKAEREHKQQSITPQVLSPAAPDTPPLDPPAVPQKSESRNTSTNTLVPDVLANTTSLLSVHSRDSSVTLTVSSEPQVRSPQHKKTYGARILTLQPSPPAENDSTSPLALPSSAPNANLDIKVTAFTPSPVALPTKKPSEPSPAATNPTHERKPSTPSLTAAFPKPTSPITPGTVFQGPELGIVHFQCYQSHRQMRSSANKICPTACMICRKKEAGPRWMCTFCCLSACAACMQTLGSVPGKDLRVALQRIEQRDSGGDRDERERVGQGNERSERGSERLGLGSRSEGWK